MSGHSKWANIKHRKGRQDAKRGKAFAKLIKGIEAAARNGGDPDGNPSLATAIQNAKDVSVPKDNIERAITRGSGDAEGVDYEEIWYEGYAAGGVALYVQILTDNRNRAAADVRSTLTKNGGSLGEPGSVAYLFEQKGYLLVTGDEDTVMMAALDGGADDVEEAGDQWEITCTPGDLAAVRSALEAEGVIVDQGDVTQIAAISVPLNAVNAAKVLRLVDALEDLDDVQSVHANFDIPDEVIAELED
jgi:YebC/PmpR family DNA-binding regulatory protein